MNFSSLRHIYLDWHLYILGHEEPSCIQHGPLVAPPRPRPQVTTYRRVLERLCSLPDLESLKALQARQMRVRPGDEVDRKLKLFCRCAGRPLIRAFGILAELQVKLEAKGAEELTRNTFCLHEWLVEALLEVRKSHAIWEVSVGDKAFSTQHPRPRGVRYEYLWYTVQLLYIIADLNFPGEFHEYLQEMESFLGRRDWRELLVLDSPLTYERSKKRARPEIIAPVGQYPKRYLLYSQTALKPHFVHNTSVYGHQMVANERSLRSRKGA